MGATVGDQPSAAGHHWVQGGLSRSQPAGRQRSRQAQLVAALFQSWDAGTPDLQRASQQPMAFCRTTQTDVGVAWAGRGDHNKQEEAGLEVKLNIGRRRGSRGAKADVTHEIGGCVSACLQWLVHIKIYASSNSTSPF